MAWIMASDVDLLRQQEERCALQASRQQQLQQDSPKAEAEAALRRKAAETTKGIIKLNVGGVKFTTSLTTLTAVPESYFASLFSGDWQQVLTAEGEVFLDRDGESFKPILEYLRSARDQQAFLLPADLGTHELARLAAEAQYYGLTSLHRLMQAADNGTKSSREYKYKHVLINENSWRDEEQKVQQLYQEGWELMQTSIAGCGRSSNMRIWLTLRRRH